MELHKVWQGDQNNPQYWFVLQLLYQVGDNKHNLSRHVLRHLEEGKTFACNFCDKESRSSNGLSQHVVKRHPTGSVLSTSLSDQKPEESSTVIDEEDVKDAYDQNYAYDHEMEELEKEEDILEIDLDAEKEDGSVEDKFKDDEDGNDQSRRETTEELNEKIEAMIEKVISFDWKFNITII